MLSLLGSFVSVLETIGRVILAFVVLMIMVLIHETGHYTAGKLLKFKINEFSIGMGPKLFSKTKKNGEIFSLRLLPLGGFCAFEGEDDDDTPKGSNNQVNNEQPTETNDQQVNDSGTVEPNKDNSAALPFNSQKPWKRIIVLVSGALFNFISALLICVLLFGVYGETVAVVNNVYDYAPEINKQLQSGDIIYKINGKNVFVLDDISRYMADEMSITVQKPNGEFVTYNGVQRNTYYSVTVENLSGEYLCGDRALAVGDMIYKIDGKPISQKGDLTRYLDEAAETCTVTVVGDANYDYVINTTALREKFVFNESPYTGVGMSVSYKTHKFAFGTALLRVFPYCGEVALLVLRTLGGLFTGAVGVKDIGGPITTISMTSQVVSYGFPSILALIVLISVNLAVFNLLPVPALDGCKIIFVLIEWIAGKPINRKVEGWINGIGFILLLGFVILVDLLKL